MNHQEMFGSARWIGCGKQSDTPCIRADFAAPQEPRGTITICGLGLFELYVNGLRVGEELFVPVVSDYCPRNMPKDGRPFPEQGRHRCYCLRYDLTEYLRGGVNHLAVALGPGFFATPMNGYDAPVRFGEVRLCYRIEMTGGDGSAAEAASGPEARWAQSYVTTSDFIHGERHDLRLLPEDWTTADCRDWKPVSLLAPMDTDYQLQDCPADRIIRRIKPKLVNRFPGCDVYDAGENVTGWVELVDQSAAGEEVSLRFSENLSCCGALDEMYMHWQFFEAVSDGKGRLLHPRFTWHGFRYFSVKGRAKVKSVAVIHSDIAPASSFVCSHETLNWLYDAFRRTMLNNLHGGIPSDCPHLERRGYTGDGQLTAEAALLTLNHTALMRKWIHDIADGQDIHSGHVQNTAPYVRSGGGPGGWGCAIIMVPLACYRHTGDAQLLREFHGAMLRYLDYLRDHSDEGLVTRDAPGEWCLGDWCCPGGVALPEPFVNTYFLMKSLDAVAEVERILGLPENPEWTRRRRAAAEAMRLRYFDPATGDWAGGVQGANAFALDAGLGSEATLERLAARYEALGGYDTGIFGTEVLTRVLLERGRPELALRLMTSENPASFAAWKRAGATTLWEYWPGDVQRSMNHPMFGAVVKELFHYVLGLRQEEGSAGWTRVRIEPALAGQLPFARGHITTPRGKLAVAYETRENGVAFEAEIPPDTEAALKWKGALYPLRAGKSRLELPR